MELEKEQLEADLRFKSKELSGVVMTNIAHQEFLNSLKEELQQQKLSGQYTRKNLDKLLSMINQNMVSMKRTGTCSSPILTASTRTSSET